VANDDIIVTDLELLAKKLELLRSVNKEAYDEVSKVFAQQKLYKEQLEANLITTEEYKKKTDELNESLTEEGQKLRDLVEEQDRLTEATEKYNKALGILNTTYSVLKGAQTKVLDTTSTLTGVNLSHLNSLTSMTAASADYIRKQDQLIVNLRRSTGFANRYTATFGRLQDEFLNAGMTSEDLTQSISALTNNFAAFAGEERSVQDGLIRLSKEAKQLGVEFELFGTTVDKLRFAYGFMGEAAKAGFGKVIEIANKTGQSVAKTSQDLVDLGPDLARFGSQGIKVFEKLSIRARSLGLGVKQAFDISELFDTFESAANVAGRLNAQLGLQLNSVELMKASSEERLDILRQEFKLKGIDFKTAGRRQRQMIASILGVDTETAGRLLGGGMDISKFQAEKTTEKQRISLQEKANAATERSIKATTDLVNGILNLDKRMEGLINVAGSQGMAGGMAAANVVTGILGVGAGIGGSILTRKFLLRGGGGAVPDMAKNLLAGKAPSVPTPTPARPPVLPGPGGPGKMLPSGLFVPAGSSLDNAARTGTKVVTDTATKGAVTAAGKAGLGKMLGRAIPGVGFAIGAMGAYDRAKRGDYGGALAELGIGALSFVPGVGGLVASLGGYAALAARDTAKSTREMNERNMAMQGGQAAGMPSEIVIKELIVHSVVELEGDKLGETVKTYIKQNAEVVQNIIERPLQPTQ
jgi:hypothetical protein